MVGKLLVDTTELFTIRTRVEKMKPVRFGGEKMRVDWRPETGDAGEKKKVPAPKGDFVTALASATAANTSAAGLESVLNKAAARFGLRPELLRAVAQAESGFNPRAVSSAGAQGIMQLMPATAKALGVRDPFDPVENIFAGAAYLRSLLDRFGGNEALALAAYNAGPGAVRRFGGIPPYAETQAYVNRVLSLSGSPQSIAVSQPERAGTGSLPPEVPARDFEDAAEEEKEALGMLVVSWQYALAQYLLHAATEGEEK